jgi:DNA polymerase (family X)
MGGKALGGQRVDRDTAEELFEMISREVLFGTYAMSGSLILAGSYRRGKDDMGDLDILVTPDDDAALEQFNEWCYFRLGEQKSGKPLRTRLFDGVQVEFYVATPANQGTQLQMWTGSARFNVKLRRAAKKMGYSMSQYGFRNKETGELVTCASEVEVFDFLGLDYVQPEDR